jgi:hypothetical protein
LKANCWQPCWHSGGRTPACGRDPGEKRRNADRSNSKVSNAIFCCCSTCWYNSLAAPAAVASSCFCRPWAKHCSGPEEE